MRAVGNFPVRGCTIRRMGLETIILVFGVIIVLAVVVAVKKSGRK